MAVLRDEKVRIEDENTASLNVLEFIEKHRAENWTHSLLNELGPGAMTQMADLASLMEVMLAYVNYIDLD